MLVHAVAARRRDLPRRPRARLLVQQRSEQQCPARTPRCEPAQFCSYHSADHDVPTAGCGHMWCSPSRHRPSRRGGLRRSRCTCHHPPGHRRVAESRAGARLVSPLARSEWGAMTNPNLNGWFGLSGTEMGDNRCVPLDKHVDDAIRGWKLGRTPMSCQHGFNNAGAIVNEPFSPDCAWAVTLEPLFVMPSAANQGDVIQFDGAQTKSTLLIPGTNYVWDFGDGATATGPSQVPQLRQRRYVRRHAEGHRPRRQRRHAQPDDPSARPKRPAGDHARIRIRRRRA